MHAIFIAHGPLASRIKATSIRRRNRNSQDWASSRLKGLLTRPREIEIHEDITVIPGFDNLEIYNLITKKLLKLDKVAKQNGTVGFWDRYLGDD